MLFIIFLLSINYSNLNSHNIIENNNSNKFIQDFFNTSIGLHHYWLTNNEEYNLILESNGYDRIGNININGIALDFRYHRKNIPISFSIGLSYFPAMFSFSSTKLDSNTKLVYSGGQFDINIGLNRFIILHSDFDPYDILEDREYGFIIHPDLGLSYNMLVLEADSAMGDHVFGLDHSALSYNIGLGFDFYYTNGHNGIDIFLKIGRSFELSSSKILRFAGNYFQNPENINIDQSGFYIKLGIGPIIFL